MMDVNSNRRSVVAGALTPLSAPLCSQASAAPEQEQACQSLLAYAEAWRRGETAALVAAYHDDFTLYYPGRHALAGVHRGKAEALRILQEVARRTRRELVSVIDIMIGRSEGALHVTERWMNESGGPVTVERLFAYTFKEGRLFECRLFDADQSVVEAFLGAPSCGG